MRHTIPQGCEIKTSSVLHRVLSNSLVTYLANIMLSQLALTLHMMKGTFFLTRERVGNLATLSQRFLIKNPKTYHSPQQM